MTGEYVAAIRINFSDGGPSEAQLLHTGSLADCVAVRDAVPAMVYAGARPDPVAYAVVIPRSTWDKDTIPMETSNAKT